MNLATSEPVACRPPQPAAAAASAISTRTSSGAGRRDPMPKSSAGRCEGLKLGDRPGVARLEQTLEVALALVGARPLELLFHLAVVDRSLDVAEDADRGRAVRRVREPGDRRSQ